jgi:hypothetical protein
MECKNETQKYIKSVYYMKQQQMEQETIMSRVVSHWCSAENPAQTFEASELTPAHTKWQRCLDQVRVSSRKIINAVSNC